MQLKQLIFDFISKSSSDRMKHNTLHYYTQHTYRARERGHDVTGSERLSKSGGLYLHDGNTLYAQSNKH